MLRINTSSLVYDAGALVAAERDDKIFVALHQQALQEKRLIVVPHCVVAQVWRNGARQVRLVRLLRGCRLESTTIDIAKHAGVLLGRSALSDAVDAIVVSTALYYHAAIVTSDPTDLKKLAATAEPLLPPTVIPI